MATKSKSDKRRVPTSVSFTVPPVPVEGVKIPAPHALKMARERAGLSQPDLARECGVSRDVIANYESGRTKTSVEDLLKVWRVLEVKERALDIPREKGGLGAAEAVLGLLWVARLNAQKRLAEIDGQIANLQRVRDSATRQVGEIESEEAEYRAIKEGRKVHTSFRTVQRAVHEQQSKSPESKPDE